MPSTLVGPRLRITHDDDVLQNSHGSGSLSGHEGRCGGASHKN